MIKYLLWIVAVLALSACEPKNKSTTSAAESQNLADADNYAALVAKTVKRNIHYLGDKEQDIRTTVYVATDAQGVIKQESIKIRQPSGDPTWDKAVVDALKRTEKFPAKNGKHPVLEFVFIFDPSEKK